MVLAKRGFALSTPGEAAPISSKIRSYYGIRYIYCFYRTQNLLTPAMQLTKAMNSFQASTLAETTVARSFCHTFCNPITLGKKTPKRGCDGFSLVEAVFACALVAVFFIGIF